MVDLAPSRDAAFVLYQLAGWLAAAPPATGLGDSDPAAKATECTYPAAELEYLVVGAYNNAVYYRSVERAETAESWCTLALKLCQPLVTARHAAAAGLHTRLLGLYASIIDTQVAEPL